MKLEDYIYDNGIFKPPTLYDDLYKGIRYITHELDERNLWHSQEKVYADSITWIQQAVELLNNYPIVPKLGLWLFF